MKILDPLVVNLVKTFQVDELHQFGTLGEGLTEKDHLSIKFDLQFPGVKEAEQGTKIRELYIDRPVNIEDFVVFHFRDGSRGYLLLKEYLILRTAFMNARNFLVLWYTNKNDVKELHCLYQ